MKRERAPLLPSVGVPVVRAPARNSLQLAPFEDREDRADARRLTARRLPRDDAVAEERRRGGDRDPGNDVDPSRATRAGA